MSSSIGPSGSALTPSSDVFGIRTSDSQPPMSHEGQTIEDLLGDIPAIIFALRGLVGDRKYFDAASLIEEALRHHPELDQDPAFALLSGRVAANRERYKEARQRLRVALRDQAQEMEARYELGRVWLMADKLDQAVEQLTRVAESDNALIPWRVHANSALAVAYSGLDRPAAAQKAMHKAVSYKLSSGQLLADEARRLTTLGKTEEARVHLARALQTDVGCADAFFQFANLMHVGGSSVEALQLLSYGLEYCPCALPMLALSGEILVSLGYPGEAAQYYQRCVDLSQRGARAAEYRLNYARSMYRHQQPDVALHALQELLDSHPRSGLRREARARLNALSGKSQRQYRLEEFPRALQERNYCGPNTLANVLSFLGLDLTQQDVAERVFSDGARWHDIVGFLDNLRGYTCYAFLSNLAQLKDILERNLPVIVGEYAGTDGHCIAVIGFDDQMGVIIAQDPLFFEPVEIPYSEFAKTWSFTDNLAVVVVPEEQAEDLEAMGLSAQGLVEDWITTLRLRASGNFEDVMQRLSAMLDEEPDYQSARRTLAETAIMMGDWQSALDACEEQLERTPHCYWALRFGGDAAWRLGDPARTWDYYSHAVRLYADDPTLRYLRGELAFSAGDRKRGRTEMARALEAEPGALAPRLRLAQDYVDAEDWEKARYHAEGVLELSPGHPAASKLLRQIKQALK